MIDLSLAGLLGAIAGTVVAGFAYGPLIGLLERAVHTQDGALTADERARSQENQALARRIMLALDILIFAGIGFWLGSMLGE
jgi:hypothetical protein